MFPLSALLMTINVGFVLVRLVLFFLSFLIRLSSLFCLRLHSFRSSSLILHSAVSIVL